jgi:CubicO group peptidase (beta-lactamase class C family)
VVRGGTIRRAIACAIAPLLLGAGPQDPLAGALAREAAAGFSGAVRVSRGETVLVDGAFGTVRGQAVRPQARFWIASISKQFTAAAVLRCQELGLLRLDDALGDRLPGVPSDKRGITLRQLLTHTSGLGQGYAFEGQADRSTAMARVLAVPLAGPPGSGFRYSNENYAVLVAVVEQATGRPYPEFVREELWRPARLRETGFARDAGAERVAPAREPAPARQARPSWGGGEGVYSTTGDLARWVGELRAGKILSPSSLEVLFTGEVPIQEGRAAAGWFTGRTARETATLFTRGNEDFGPNGLVYVYPDRDLLVVVLSHGGDAPDGRPWSRRMLTAIEGALGL